MKGAELDTDTGHFGAADQQAGLTHLSHSAPSTSSGYIAIARSTTTPLPQGKKYIDIQLLTREHLYLAVDVKCKVGDVYRYVCSHIGMNCINLFGLAYYAENEYRFCDPDERLSKYAMTKNWQKAPGWGIDLVGNPSVILYLRVHTYVDYVRLINCPVSLLHYYLQLRENVRIQWEPTWVAEERCFEAAALALQADYGDYRADKHSAGYFRADAYFPMWVINARGLDYVLRHVPSMHHDLEGLEPHDARIRYCREASSPPCPVNMHLYRLRRQKTDTQEFIYLGIAERGLELFEQKPSGERQHLCSYSWSKIGKLAFDRKKFTLVSLDGQKLVLYTSSDVKSRYLLKFCRAVHQNIIHLQSAIVDARRRETEEKKLFRESYIYSDTADLDWVRKMDAQSTPFALCEYSMASSSTTAASLDKYSHLTPTSATNGSVVICCGGGGQRVSLVSDASSNTTSGIVSDRQHTHEDSENENEADPDFEVTTGCDSSPLVSELSLATTGTSLAVCTNGGSHSQQASPVCESGDAEDNEQVQLASESMTVIAIQKAMKHDNCRCPCEDGEEAYAGESSSSAGPCSDRTVTAAADDTQSTESASTTGKLEDLCAESELCATTTANAVPSELRTWSPNQPLKFSSAAPNGGSVSIAELRRLTLQDYEPHQAVTKRRVSPPILSRPAQFDAEGRNQEARKQGNAGEIMRSLSTQSTALSAGQVLENGHCGPTLPNQYQGSVEITLNDAMSPPRQFWDNEAVAQYRVVATQSSHEGKHNGDIHLHRSTPSPPRVEPPPPPPYPYEVECAGSKIAQSYSLSHLPSSSAAGNSTMAGCIAQQQRRLQRTSVDGLPNYEQALQYKAEVTHRSPAPALDPASVPWLHTAAAKRWPTVSGIHPAVLDQLVAAIGTRKLQQAQSEPGLAGPYYGGSDDYLVPRRCCYGRPADLYPCQLACLPYAVRDTALDTGAYRSVSTYQLTSGAGKACACHLPYGPPPPVLHHPNHFHSYYHYGSGQQPAACTPNGLYVKQQKGRQLAGTAGGHRLHPLDCQAPSQVYNGGKPMHNASNKAVARVHSMYEAAKADQVRQSLEYEYYRRFEQQVVQHTRRELKKQQMELERQVGASLSDSTCQQSKQCRPDIDPNTAAPKRNQNHDHGKLGRYCESCQEMHTAGKIDLAQLKDIIRSQNVDLPLMTALCNDNSWEHQQRSDATNAKSINDSTAHPLLRQKKSASRPDGTKPPMEVAPLENSPAYRGRPVTWHESNDVGPSSWPPCYDR